jgi:hypothetical protein
MTKLDFIRLLNRDRYNWNILHTTIYSKDAEIIYYSRKNEPDKKATFIDDCLLCDMDM